MRVMACSTILSVLRGLRKMLARFPAALCAWWRGFRKSHVVWWWIWAKFSCCLYFTHFCQPVGWFHSIISPVLTCGWWWPHGSQRDGLGRAVCLFVVLPASISSPTKMAALVMVSLVAHLLKPLASHTTVIQIPVFPSAFSQSFILQLALPFFSVLSSLGLFFIPESSLLRLPLS